MEKKLKRNLTRQEISWKKNRAQIEYVFRDFKNCDRKVLKTQHKGEEKFTSPYCSGALDCVIEKRNRSEEIENASLVRKFYSEKLHH